MTVKQIIAHFSNNIRKDPKQNIVFNFYKQIHKNKIIFETLY